MTDDFSKVPSEPAFLTVPEVAGLLRLSCTTVYRLVEARRIPFMRVSCSLRFSREDVVAWARAGGRKSFDVEV